MAKPRPRCKNGPLGLFSLGCSGTVILSFLDLCDKFSPRLYMSWMFPLGSTCIVLLSIHSLHSRLLELSSLPCWQRLRCLLLRCDGSLKIA
jgi:hypothetical protein